MFMRGCVCVRGREEEEIIQNRRELDERKKTKKREETKRRKTKQQREMRRKRKKGSCENQSEKESEGRVRE